MNIQIEKILKKINTIKEYMYTPVYSFEKILYKEGEIKGAEQPNFETSDWDSFAVGQCWGGRDITCWFRITFNIPQNISNKRLAAIIQPGKRFHFISTEGGDLREYELLIFMDGELLQSVDVRRNIVPLWDKVKIGQKHVLALEAFSGLESHQHCFEQADLVVINDQVEDFYYNTKTAFETLSVIGKYHPESHQLVKVLEQALLMVDFLNIGESGFYESIISANKFLQNELYSTYSVTKHQPKVIGVGHAHIDVAWMWQTKHARKKAVRTFANALRQMKFYPDYRFTQSQAQLYKYVQEAYPLLFNQIKEKVKTGKWEATGGMWVEADCNIPGGESLVRQFLYGKRYFQKEFGLDNKVAWLPDGFGFCYTLPQIIKKSGMHFFMTTKLSWSQFTKFPYDTFMWEGLDGTRILAHFVTTPDRRGWNDYGVDLNAINVYNCWDNYRQKQENQEILLSFGWGDGGGGPTYEMQENAKRISKMSTLPEFRQGQAETFFTDLAKRVKHLPVWNDELYLQLHRGCYTSQSQIKRNNRYSEILYHNTELFSAIIYLHTGEYPDKELNKGWELILLNQFHDILPGSSIPEVYQDSEKEFDQIESIGTYHLNKALDRICSAMETIDNQKTLLAFNSLSWNRSDLVCIPLEQDLQDIKIVDSEDQEIPYQVLHDKKHLLMYLSDVPSLGYKQFYIKENTRAASFSSNIKVTTRHMENQYFEITLDAKGLLTRIFDKRFNREIVAEGNKANILQVFEDRPLRNDAWDIDVFYQDKYLELSELEHVEVIENGPIRGGLVLKRRFLDSLITQYIYIYHEISRIDFETEIDWRQHQTLLKVAFPLKIHANKATYEIPYGSIERPTHWNTDWDMARFEVPAQKWADISEGDFGVSLFNDCKYGYDVKDNIMRLTLIKSAIEPDPNADIGKHVFKYSLFPHQGNWQNGNMVKMAYQFNYDLLTKLKSTNTEANTENEFSFATVNKDNVIIETVKKAEQGSAVIIRVYEVYNCRGQAELTFSYPIRDAKECNLIEQEPKAIEFSDRQLRFHINPYEIKTFMVDFDV